ncbi:GNAT family N-acetyltransferase [Ramlibacter sp. AN1133]|uniref:GNAT family N-acetyltransferase n=1 Tax=Ramlibacter sp. AN1133 TaxID=3133429 RepID=UPI0030C0ECF9
MIPIHIRRGEAPEFEAFLCERIYAYNAAATGYHDAECFSAALEGQDGAVEAGVCGYTWGGCCYVSYLWVLERLRGQGIASSILAAVERHARATGCRLVLLSTHSFQAPGFYRRHGYRELAMVPDHPLGHASFFLAKQLAEGETSSGGR